MSEDGYKGHKPGSRKGDVHQLFDDKGADVALTKGIEMGLAAATLRAWIKTWGGKVDAQKVERRRSDYVDPSKKRVRIFDTWSGVMVKEGPEQSLVRVLEAHEALVGLTLVFLNKDLVEMKSKPARE